METLYPSSCISNWNWLMQESKSTKWTREENKRFESALAVFDKDTPDRWFQVAAMIPGKSVFDVMEQYKELVEDVSCIEAGLVPTPGYLTSSFTLDLMDNRGFNAFRKRTSTSRCPDQERKKGVPWTEDEHRRFLRGLERHGKGDWRNISRNFVMTKTPTQVASHAQKYYKRLESEGKEKRRPSIHDIRMLPLTNTTPSDHNKSPSFEKSTSIPQPQKFTSTPKLLLDWNHSNDGAAMYFDSTHSNPFVASPYEIASHDLKLQRGGSHVADIGPYTSGFQIQPSRYQIRG